MEKHQKCFLKTRAYRNSCSKGNYIDRNISVLPETDKVNVYILRSKCERTPEILSVKRVWLKILAQKDKGILHGQRGQKKRDSEGLRLPGPDDLS